MLLLSMKQSNHSPQSVSFEGVTRSFGKAIAVDSLDFVIQPGEFCVLIGTSGCGKTTTLKMINRLVDPTSGKVLIGGVNVGDIPAVDLRRRTGYVIQGVGLIPHLSVARNISLVPELLHWDRSAIQERVAELFELIGLDRKIFGHRLPEELSGGQRQRIGFARALAARPSILLLDEPFGALDPITRDNLREILRSIQKRLGFTAVMVTHDMTEALLLADRIVVMDAGRIVQQGSPKEISHHPKSAFVESLIATPKRQADALSHVLGD